MSTKSKAEFFFEIFIKFGVMRNNLFTRNNVRLDHFFFQTPLQRRFAKRWFFGILQIAKKIYINIYIFWINFIRFDYRSGYKLVDKKVTIKNML